MGVQQTDLTNDTTQIIVAEYIRFPQIDLCIMRVKYALFVPSAPPCFIPNYLTYKSLNLLNQI